MADVTLCVLKSLNYEFVVDEDTTTKEFAVIRTKFDTPEQVLSFVKKVETYTKTNFIIKITKSRLERMKFRKVWICHHSSHRKIAESTRNAGCESFIDALIKKVNKNTQKNDPFLKRKEPLPCKIKLNLEHSHSPENANVLRKLRVFPKIIKEFEKYFNEGLAVCDARRKHETKLLANYDYSILSNSAFNPTMNQVYYIYYRWRIKNFGRRSKRSYNRKNKLSADKNEDEGMSSLERIDITTSNSPTLPEHADKCDKVNPIDDRLIEVKRKFICLPTEIDSYKMDQSPDFKVAFLTDGQKKSLQYTAFASQFMEMLMNFVNYNLAVVLKYKERFKSLKISTGSVKELPNDENFLKKYKDENLIFYVSDSLDVYQNEFPKEIELKMKETCPNLSNLLLENHQDSHESYFIKGTTLVYKIPLLLINRDLFKNYIEKKLSTLFSAVQEISTFNFPEDLVPKVINSLENVSKSKVCLVNPAKRHRTSPYPMISVTEALELIMKEITSVKTETKSLRDCFSFVLAEDVVASEPYPMFPASVKDGYAVIAKDCVLTNEEPCILKVVGSATAGFNPNATVTPGTCIRVSTGGVIPDGADAVIQVEDTRVSTSSEEDEILIEVMKQPKEFQDVRAVGSDVTKGELLIPAGKKISAAEIGIMSTCGIKNVLVYKKPHVAVMSTGDEVVEPECPVSPGCIRDSNKNTLCHMLIENRIPFLDVGIAKDDPDDVKLHLLYALSKADIIISTGGVSMGEKDVLKQVLEEDFEATVHFGRVHMKPGKPTTFSTVNFKGEKKFIFSLPGNPVSACVCFFLFVIPCIKKYMGLATSEHKTVKVKLGHDITLDERPEFYRVALNCGDDGVFVTESTGGQQSSRLLSMQNADALLVLPPKTEEQYMLQSGTLVNAILLKPI